MTVYYVSKQGSDAFNGLGPDASHATNKPWLTIGKALGAAGIASGDTVYIGPGTYREVVSVAMTSAIAETFVLGDPTNAQGFKDGSGVLLAPGDVIHTAYITNDATAASATATLTLAGRDFLTIQYITFAGANNTTTECIDATTTNSVNITIRDCAFLPGALGSLVGVTGLADIAQNWLIERCSFLVPPAKDGVVITMPTSAVADYDSNIVIQNCLFLIGHNAEAVFVTASGAAAFKAGGVAFYENTCIGGNAGLRIASANIATSIPGLAYNNTFFGANTGILAITSGQVTQNANRILCTTAVSNTAAGANTHTTSAYALMLEIGQSMFAGRIPRPFATPMAGSTLLGWSAQTVPSSVDAANRPRPAGGGSSTAAAPVTGTATAGAAGTLTDSTKSWTVNQYAGYTVRLTGGTGSGQWRYVTSNTATVLSVSVNWTTTPDATSVYTVDNPGIYNAAGYMERHDTAAPETTTTQAGARAVKIVGPGDHDFVVPVDASSTTISIYARYDSNHGTANKPQVILLANGSIAVATETKTMTAAADTWEQLTFAAITPSAKGVVVLRCTSRAAAGQGVAYFDTEAGGATSTSGFDYALVGEPIRALVPAAGGAASIHVHPGMTGGMNG